MSLYGSPGLRRYSRSSDMTREERREERTRRIKAAGKAMGWHKPAEPEPAKAADKPEGDR